MPEGKRGQKRGKALHSTQSETQKKERVGATRKREMVCATTKQEGSRATLSRNLKAQHSTLRQEFSRES